MGGSYQIDIVCALLLQLQENFHQMLGGDHTTGLSQGDIVILTEHTAQITAGEKDGSGAGSTGDTWLFPVMQGSSCCHEFSGLTAVSGLPGEAVYVADTGAKHTVGHDITEPNVSVIIRKSSSS